MKSEKLLHLFWEFPPHIKGGLGVAGENLCNALASMANVDIAHPQFSKTIVQTEGIKYRIFQIKSSQHTASPSVSSYSSELYTTQLSSQINEFNAGVKAAHFTQHHSIHAHDWITAKAAHTVQTANKSRHIPVVLHIHSTQAERIGAHSKGAIFAQEKSAMLKADKIIAVSHKTKQSIIDHYQVDPNKIKVIHNASPKIRVDRASKNQPPTLLFVGRLESQKSPFFAIEVICRTLKTIPKSKAIIAGSGSMLESVRELVKFKKMDHRIEVLGDIPHNKMHLIYAASDLLIMPSAAEPFGLVALEAAESGLAVMMSDRCGVAEILKSSPTISINAKLSFEQWVTTATQLLTDTGYRKTLVKSQLSEIRDCSWDKAAKELLNTLNE